MRRRLISILLTSACLILVAEAARADVDLAWLFKWEEYEQVSHAAPTTPVYNAFYPYVRADIGDFDAPATLTGPTGSLGTTFFAGSNFVTSEHYVDLFANRAALDAAAPNGDYTFTLNGGLLDSQSGSIPLVNPWPEQIPTFTPASFDALQSANPGQSIDVSWNSFVPAPIAADPRVRLFLLDLTDYSFPIEEQAMPASTTNYTIPSNILQAGRDYALQVIFSNATETTGPAFGSASVLSDVYVQTAAHFSVVPEPASLSLLAVGGLALLLLRRRR